MLSSQIAADPDRGGTCTALRTLRSAGAICPSVTSHLLLLSSVLLCDYSSKDN
jgi:hypothetical protein